MRFAPHVTGTGWVVRRRNPLTMYCVTDRLHSGRTVRVPGGEIASTVSAWLAELGADSPLVEDFARAACAGDWAVVCAVGEQLSVGVALAAAA